jgi:hypothetical protein
MSCLESTVILARILLSDKLGLRFFFRSYLEGRHYDILPFDAKIFHFHCMPDFYELVFQIFEEEKFAF